MASKLFTFTLTYVTRTKLTTPGTAEEHTRQETPTTNHIDRQPTHLTDQARSNIEKAARETHNTNTAAMHASAQQQPAIITLTQQGHQQILSANAARCQP